MSKHVCKHEQSIFIRKSTYIRGCVLACVMIITTKENEFMYQIRVLGRIILVVICTLMFLCYGPSFNLLYYVTQMFLF